LFLQRSVPTHHLHSFPTRRSSDLTELLHPLDKGGRIRTYQMLRELVRQHRITYLTLDDGRGGAEAVDRAPEYCSNLVRIPVQTTDRKSTRLNSSHDQISYAVFCLK